MPTVIIPPTDVSPYTGTGNQVLATNPTFPGIITVNGVGGVNTLKGIVVAGTDIAATDTAAFQVHNNVDDKPMIGFYRGGTLRSVLRLNTDNDFRLLSSDLSTPANLTAGNLTASGGSVLLNALTGNPPQFRHHAVGTADIIAGVNGIRLLNNAASAAGMSLDANNDTTFSGNLTVNGTGTSTFGGTIRAGAGSGETLSAGSLDTAADIGIKSTQGIVQGAARIVTFTNGNLLIGTTTDGGQKLQVAGAIAATTGAANNALVARYNSSNSLFGVTVNSAGQGVVSENTDASTGSDKYSKTGLPAFRLGNTGGSGTVPFWVDVAASGTAGNAITWTNAFQIDSSQNATFAGKVGIGVSPASWNLNLQQSAVNSAVRIISPTALGLNDSSIYIAWASGSKALIAASYESTGSYRPLVLSAGGVDSLTLDTSGNSTFAGAIAINNTVQTAAAVASTHKVTISIGGSTYYLLATNV